MITEDYVSFEIANLLKEKGFDESTIMRYDSNGEISSDGRYGHYNSLKKFDFVSAPTLQLAMKWLREEHHLFIAIHPRLSFTDYYWITADIYKVKRKSSLYHTEDVDDYYCVAICDETSFEKACEAAIKYCLEKLI